MMWEYKQTNIPPLLRTKTYHEGRDVIVNLAHIDSMSDQKSSTTEHGCVRITFHGVVEPLLIRSTVDQIWKELHRDV